MREEKKLENLLEDLDKAKGRKDWDEISWEYECFGSHSGGWKNTDNQYEQILEKHGYKKESADFVYRTFTVTYGRNGRYEHYEQAFIVREALANPEGFNMKAYLVKKHGELHKNYYCGVGQYRHLKSKWHVMEQEN